MGGALSAIRLLKILAGGNLPPSPDDNGDVPAYSPVPSVNQGKPLPNGGPDPELDRIRNMYSTEPKGVSDYRNFVNNAPNKDDYKASALRKIVGVLAGIGTQIGTKDVGLGYHTADSIIDEPYNEAVSNFNIKKKGLGDIAALDEKSKEAGIKGEEAVQNIQTRRTQQDATRQMKQASLDERAREANQKHEVAIRNAKTAEDRLAANDDYKSDVLALRQEAQANNLDFKNRTLAFRENTAERTVQSPDDPNQNIIVNKMSNKKVGDAPLAGADRTTVSNAGEVLLGTSKLKDMIKNDPTLPQKFGALTGKAREAWIEHGFSSDPALMDFSRELDTVEKKHSKLVGGSRSLAMIKDVRNSLLNIGQTPEGVQSTLRTLESSANDAKSARVPKSSTMKTIKLSSGKEIQVEE